MVNEFNEIDEGIMEFPKASIEEIEKAEANLKRVKALFEMKRKRISTGAEEEFSELLEEAVGKCKTDTRRVSVICDYVEQFLTEGWN